MDLLKRAIVGVCALFATATASALPLDIGVVPAPDTTIESLESFSITSGWLELKNGVSSATVLVNGLGLTANLTAVSYDEIKFTFAEPYTLPGNCNIMIPEDIFLMGWEGDPNPIIEFSYKIENDNPGPGPGPGEIMDVVPAGFTFWPSAGSECYFLNKFGVVAENEFFLTPSSRTCHITINGERVDAITHISGEYYNEITWELAYPINEEGYYTIYIPEGEFFGMDEIDNPPFIVTVHVKTGEAEEPVYYPGAMTSDPASGSTVKELSRIAICSEKLSSLYLGPEAEGIVVKKDGEIVDTSFTLTPDPDDFNEAHVIWMDFAAPLTQKGEYVIEIPPMAFEVGKYPENWYVDGFTIRLNVDPAASVEELMLDSKDCRYYDLQGRPLPGRPSNGLYIRSTQTTLAH